MMTLLTHSQRRVWPVAAVFACVPLLLGTGCNGGLDDAPDNDANADVNEQRVGLVVIDQIKEADSNTLSTTAHFVRFDASARGQVEALLGIPAQVRRQVTGDPGDPGDNCKLVKNDDVPVVDTQASTEDVSAIELLEAGDIQLSADQTRIKLEAVRFPALVPFISGLMYAERQAVTSWQAPLLLQSSGSDLVGPFSIKVYLPQAPEIAQIAAVPAAANSRATLRVNWQELPNRNDGSVMTLTLSAAKAKHNLVCQVEDDGDFVVPLSVLSASDRAVAEGVVIVEATRTKQVGFSAAGLDAGELWVRSQHRVAWNTKQ